MNDDEVVRFDRELAMLADPRRRLRESEGPGFDIPTSVADGVLDERNRATHDLGEPTGCDDADPG